MRRLALLIPGLAAAALLLPATAGATSCTGTDLQPTAQTIAPAILTTICLANEKRAAAGVSPLELDYGLMAVALGYARRMVAEHFYEHVAPDGETLASRLAVIDYHPFAAGENMYWGSVHLSTPAAAVQGWMESEEHRLNLLDAKYHRIGVGIVVGAPMTATMPSATYVAEFDSGDDDQTLSAGTLDAATTEIIANAPTAPGPPVVGRGPKVAATRARHAVKAWFEAARTGDGTTFCRLEDNHMLESQYGSRDAAGRAACRAAFLQVSALPRASALRFAKVRTRGTRATMTVTVLGARAAFVLRKFNGHWKLDSVVR